VEKFLTDRQFSRLVRSEGKGYRPLTTEPASYVLRAGPLPSAGLAALNDTSKLRVLASFAHLTDLHVLDASSPARAEHFELLVDDPKWHIMSPMHRPFELLVNHAVAAMVSTIARNPLGAATGTQLNTVVVTGDCIDNGQQNELEAYLALVDGGTACLRYDGVQSVSAQDPRFWCPEPGRDDEWKRTYGYPSFAGLLEALNEPIISAGLGLPWLPVLGNHDVMRQGTGFSSVALERFAVGDRKPTDVPPGFYPFDALAAYLAEPASYNLGAPTRVIRADAGRRSITKHEWIRAHEVRGLSMTDASSPGGDSAGNYVVDFGEVRLIVMDTNHPFGHYQGSLGAAQLSWLEDRIHETTSWVVLATHHGLVSLTNDTAGDGTFDSQPGHGAGDGERLLAAAVAAVLHRHHRVIAWMSGHRHHHKITHRAHPEGDNQGFWEIVTTSIIDWPSQARSIEIVQTPTGEIGIICTPIDHDGPLSYDPASALGVQEIASIHRELAVNLVGPHTGDRMARLSGQPEDRYAVLGVRAPS
jgi:metallophosphoesterase (TIGR03767 family)